MWRSGTLLLLVLGCGGPVEPSEPAESIPSEAATDTPPADYDPSLAQACDSVCERYATCGCEERCEAWCDSYLDWSFCEAEIEALILCAAGHPSPCTWLHEPWQTFTCADEISTFSMCSGNSFFPLPGVPESCTEG